MKQIYRTKTGQPEKITLPRICACIFFGCFFFGVLAANLGLTDEALWIGFVNENNIRQFSMEHREIGDFSGICPAKPPDSLACHRYLRNLLLGKHRLQPVAWMARLFRRISACCPDPAAWPERNPYHGRNVLTALSDLWGCIHHSAEADLDIPQGKETGTCSKKSWDLCIAFRCYYSHFYPWNADRILCKYVYFENDMVALLFIIRIFWAEYIRADPSDHIPAQNTAFLIYQCPDAEPCCLYNYEVVFSAFLLGRRADSGETPLSSMISFRCSFMSPQSVMLAGS